MGHNFRSNKFLTLKGNKLLILKEKNLTLKVTSKVIYSDR